MSVVCRMILINTKRQFYYIKKMGKIEFTNIIIDDFAQARRQPKMNYTHILSHIHTGKHDHMQYSPQIDHLKGLSDNWNYGTIYCTTITKQLLLLKFPSLAPFIIQIDLEIPTTLQITAELSVTVTFFDANHCPGAVLVLLEGYMGTVLYTGDMRFDRNIFDNYNYLYPPQKRNAAFDGCSKTVDLLYLDNTFLKKKFNFPPKEEVFEMLLDFVRYIIELNKHSKILIGLDLYGKEETFERLAEELNIFVVVEDSRYEILRAMNKDMKRYSTNFDLGLIQVVNKRRLCDCLEKQPDAIGIIMSGWVNSPTYRYNNRIYCLPYSLHSNYYEIQAFVKSIRPSRIYPIVQHYPEEENLFYADKRVSQRDLMFGNDLPLGKMTYTEELDELRAKYCSSPSEEYKQLLEDVQLQRKIVEMLKPPKMMEFQCDEKQMLPVHLQTVERKKYKLRTSRNEQQINRLKNRIQMKRYMQVGYGVENVDDSVEEGVINIEEEAEGKKQNIPLSIQLDHPEFKQVDPFNPPVSAKPKEKKKKHQQKMENNRNNQKEEQPTLFNWMKKKINLDNPANKDQQSYYSSEEKCSSQRERSRQKRNYPLRSQKESSELKKFNHSSQQNKKFPCGHKPDIIDVDLDQIHELAIVKNPEAVKKFIEEHPSQKISVLKPQLAQKYQPQSENINDLD